MKNLILGILILSFYVSSAQDDAVTITGAYKHSKPGWARKMTTTMYCGNSPSSWVRGKASFDKGSGLLTLTIQLETDATDAGPKGKVTAFLKDASGNTIITATSEEIKTGGKKPGKAAKRNFSGQVQIDPAIASQVKSIYLEAQCTGSYTRIWDIKLDTVKDAVGIVLTATGAAPQ